MARKRVAVIDRELCRPDACGNYLCHKVCPVDRAGTECITASELDKKALINEETCIGCQICVIKCPFGAIKVINLPQPLDELPIHSYGRNLFSLYRLPVVRPGAVTGLVGENGMGKSTLVNILSGRLKPAMGGAASWAEVLERYRGTEMQTTMEKLAAGELNTSVKPQQVDLLPKAYTGKVGELFRKLKAGTDHQWAEARWKDLGMLGIDGLMDKEIGALSGGELQTVALAAALVRKADVYFFDEPSSYLDVKQRLAAAEVIRKAAEAGTAVLVVEHDLAVADYMADYVHLLYGSAGAYGVVSQTFTVRGGINTYLDGYIREENMRFRPEPLTFARAAEKTEKRKVLLEFPAFEKHFPGFSLRVEGGTVNKADVLGILGPNATGKTTFIRMLSGELTGDSGELFTVPLKLSVKPQRLILAPGDEQLSVMEYLQEKTGGRVNQKVLETLHAGKLAERGMNTLSGGELQTVFIIEAMSREHDLLLLDEPSAFLDVEQRLRVAKLLREESEVREKPIVLIDHDVQFMDAAADRLMVFEGVAGKEGLGRRPEELRAGMNAFLRTVGVTFRRDPDSGRPRANKPGSQLDREQKESGEYYYGE